MNAPAAVGVVPQAAAAVVVDVAQVVAHALAVRPPAVLRRAHSLTAKRRMHRVSRPIAVSPIRCAPAWTALPDVVEHRMAVAAVAAPAERVAQVVVVLEVTQMAIRSVDHAAAAVAAPVTVLIAGATGLVGKELLALLLASPACRAVHSLVRKPSDLSHAKLQNHVVDFAKLGTASAQALALPKIEEVYVCLGTTIKVAGSQAAFRAIDFDAVLAVARTGIALGATKLGVISAMGASATSSVFYSRVKGEMEEAISKLGYKSVVIARPSMLAGDREALNQRVRSGEKIALVATRWLRPLIPKNYQSVLASDVAAGLYAQMQRDDQGTRVLLSGQFQTHN